VRQQEPPTIDSGKTTRWEVLVARGTPSISDDGDEMTMMGARWRGEAGGAAGCIWKRRRESAGGCYC
jgi:hypothetical protein